MVLMAENLILKELSFLFYLAVFSIAMPMHYKTGWTRSDQTSHNLKYSPSFFAREFQPHQLHITLFM